MGVLGGWSVANLGAGVPLALTTDGRAQGFHATNAGWNVVNLGIAGLGWAGISRRQRLGDPGPAALAKQRRGLRTALAVNAALDVGYIVAGWALAANAQQESRVGMGQSLVLQGGFLLAFDLSFLVVHTRALGPQRAARMSSLDGWSPAKRLR